MENEVEVYQEDSLYGVRVLYKAGDSVDIPCRYDSFAILSGYTVAFKKNGKWGVLNHQNKVLCKFIYDRIEKKDKHSHLSMAMRDGRWGLIFSDGSPATDFNNDQIKSISTEYRDINRMEYGGMEYERSHLELYCAWVLYRNGKAYIYDDRGEMTFPRGFDNVYGVVQCGRLQYFIVENNSKLGLLSRERLVCDCIYEDIQQLHPYMGANSSFVSFCYAGVKKDGKWGVIGENGSLILRCEFEKICVVGDTLALRHNLKWGVLPIHLLYQLEEDV